MGAQSAPKRRQVGPRMVEAWHRVKASPWCSDAVIVINYGRPLLNRMIKAGMIETREGDHGTELRALHTWRPTGEAVPAKTTPYQAAKVKVQESETILKVRCPACRAGAGEPCQDSQHHHYQRLVMWISAVLDRLEQLNIV